MLYMHAKLPQSCPTLCDLMDCSLPGSSVHGILQARILEWIAISFFKGIFLTQESNPCLLCLLHWQTDYLPLAPPGKPHLLYSSAINNLARGRRWNVRLGKKRGKESHLSPHWRTDSLVTSKKSKPLKEVGWDLFTSDNSKKGKQPPPPAPKR